MTESRRAPGRHLFFRRVKLREGVPLFSLELGRKVHAVVIESPVTAQAFIECAAGMSFPRRGKISFGAEVPAKAPSLRGNIGSLLPCEPPLLPGGTVEDHLKHVLRVRTQIGIQSAEDPAAVPYARPLLTRPTAALSANERRKIALGLALALKEPEALLLFEPLAALTEQETGALLEALAFAARSGTIVASVATTERSANRIAPNVHRIEPMAGSARSTSRFLLRSERPREIASILAAQQSVLSTRISTETPGELRIEVNDESEGAAAITRAICQAEVNVQEMRLLARADLGPEAP